MATDVAKDVVDEAKDEAKDEEKKTRKTGSGKGAKKKLKFPVPKEGLEKPEVEGYDVSTHARLSVADFKGDEVLFLRHQVWIHQTQITKLNEKITALEKFDPSVRAALSSVLSDLGKVTSGFANAKNTAKEKLDPAKQAEQEKLMTEEIQAHVRRLLSGQ